MTSTTRILGTVVVLAAVGYLAFEAGIFSDVEKAREMANSFCSTVTAGMPVNAALAHARQSAAERMIHVEIDGMVVSFRGGCHCSVAFKGGKAFPRAVMCAN